MYNNIVVLIYNINNHISEYLLLRKFKLKKKIKSCDLVDFVFNQKVHLSIFQHIVLFGTEIQFFLKFNLVGFLDKEGRFPLEYCVGNKIQFLETLVLSE